MDLSKNQTAISSSNSTYCSLYVTQGSWEVGGSTFYLIIGLITVVASFPTVLLNAFIILAIKQRRELQKPSNVMLSSLAVSDLLVGLIIMPTRATIDFSTFRQVSFENTCMLNLVNIFFMPLLFTAALHHVTIIAWERYVAVQKWMEYKLIITNGRLKKIAIGTWLSALFPTATYFATRINVVDRRISINVVTGWLTIETVCLLLVVLFYRKVYLGVRNRKLNEISQIDVLMKAKLESKIAKTTSLLTAGVISSFIPLFCVVLLGRFVPPIRTNAAIRRFTQIVTQLNSLLNPLLYCYRDHRFRKAIAEMLWMKKAPAMQPTVGSARFIRGRDPVRSSELQIVRKRSRRLTRSASCNLTGASYTTHGTPSVVKFKRSLSASMIDTLSSS